MVEDEQRAELLRWSSKRTTESSSPGKRHSYSSTCGSSRVRMLARVRLSPSSPKRSSTRPPTPPGRSAAHARASGEPLGSVSAAQSSAGGEVVEAPEGDGAALAVAPERRRTRSGRRSWLLLSGSPELGLEGVEPLRPEGRGSGRASRRARRAGSGRASRRGAAPRAASGRGRARGARAGAGRRPAG